MVSARSTRRTSVGIPEGPYEAPEAIHIDARSNLEAQQVADFVDRVHTQSRLRLLVDEDVRAIGLVLELLRNHFAGRLTTPTSLARASGLTHGTAIRTIGELLLHGLIVRRPRTETGRSFSLHPSTELLARWYGLAKEMRAIAGNLAAGRPSRASAGMESTEALIPPLAVLDAKLNLPRGLRVLVHADPTFMAMNALKRQFELILGVEIQSRALSIDRLRKAIVANGSQRVSDYDVLACDLPWFGEMAGSGLLLPLDELVAEGGIDIGDFVPDAVASARWNAVQYGLPVMSTAEMLVYRTDLLTEAGVAPPRTLAELLVAARILHRPDRGVYGIAWNGGRGTALGHTFMTIMAAHGCPIVELPKTADGYDGEAGAMMPLRPAFLSAEARDTAEFLRALMPLSPPEILSMAWYDRARAFASGRSAMAYSHTLLAHLYERDQESPAFGRTGHLPHPRGPNGRHIAPLGGYALAIPANIAPERIPAAWQALSLLTSAGAAKLYILNGSLASPRFSVNRDPDVAAISPVIGVVDQMARQRVLRMWPRPPIRGISQVIQIAGEEIHDMLLGLKSPATALTDAQRRAESIVTPAAF
ncbi:multiple sugar transport system substrate-binding protein [Kaistia soli DSM 19436]|uniref:Multiple sugar transport system substrate-binding protein n=2 Tax=Kaistia TaxID=166953 RepID=A0A1M5I3M5_9HYPH|nr:multiple sugar transport system substrate-binding protein [Kaistia soli DSM 19436]